ncbi:MAG: peptidoglycan DD-metalloendopeptidase family protein [Epulopiscium sp.]|nr:peptidoglycan DD-metalloendopeptidase family protein [Candidatus Epulonipiscium sp.]
MKSKKFWTYFNKKGYYGMLLLCLLTIIVTTMVTNNNLNTLEKVREENYIDLDEEYDTFDLEDVGTINAYQNDLTITEEDIAGSGAAVAEESSPGRTDEAEGENNETAKEEEVTVALETQANNNPAPLTVVEKSDEEPVFIGTEEANGETVETFSFSEDTIIQWPSYGEIVMDFSADKLVYDKTLEEYRVHPAVCIAAADNEEVRAAAKGRVEVIKKEPETGVTVVINHGDGWKTIYGQLQEELAIRQGEVVEKGQLIGKIAEPTKYSALLGKHVYFKIEKGGKPVDPKQFQHE